MLLCVFVRIYIFKEIGSRERLTATTTTCANGNYEQKMYKCSDYTKVCTYAP